MKQILTVLAVLQLCILEASFAASNPTIVVFGDSTTAPRGEIPVYAKLLEEHFRQAGISVQVINAGVGGDHTERARARFERDVLRHDPQLVVIQFGINDSAVDVWKTPPATKPRVDRTEYAANLRYFVRTLRHRGVSPILMTPNPLRWTPKLRELYGKHPYDPESVEGFNVLLEQYAETCRQVAQQERVPLIDVARAFREKDVESLLLDGMHPNAAGQKLVFEQLRPTLLESLDHVRQSVSAHSDAAAAEGSVEPLNSGVEVR